MNDEYSLIDDIKTELKNLNGFLQIIRDEEEEIYYNGIGLKPKIKFKDLKEFGIIPEKTTKKEFIKLLDWFNDNSKEFDIALKELENKK